jgi:hypothetical protein
MIGKSKTEFRHLMLCSAVLALATGLAAVPARAQDAPLAAQAQSQNQVASNQQLTQGQLDQLVAPIALYPDPLLTQVLMASTIRLRSWRRHAGRTTIRAFKATLCRMRCKRNHGIQASRR